MILYHFCPAHMVQSILDEGLTKGKFPVLGDRHYSFMDNCQWLTDEKDPQSQSWNTSQLIPYSRTACRLTIHIPDSHHKKLVLATDYVKPLPVEAQGIVLDWEGHTHWYIFKGRIPVKWIVGCKKMLTDRARLIDNSTAKTHG